MYPLIISKCEEITIVDLLVISNDENRYYCWVKNISRLLSSQVSKHGYGRYFCKRCMNSFNTEKSLERHSEHCSQHGFVRTVMHEEEIRKMGQRSMVHVS